MKLTIRGCDPLVIPDEYLVKRDSAFTVETPYVTKLAERLKKPYYRNVALPSKIMCLQTLYDRGCQISGWESLCEPMAGVGLTARIFAPKGTNVYLNEIDPSCRAILDYNYGRPRASQYDALLGQYPEADLVFVDFNNLTYKRSLKEYSQAVSGAFASARKFVILNDCSVFYFRYGVSSYDVYSKILNERVTSELDFFRVMRSRYQERFPSWRVAQVAYFRDSAFLLFYKGKADFRVKFMSKKNADPSVIEVSE